MHCRLFLMVKIANNALSLPCMTKLTACLSACERRGSSPERMAGSNRRLPKIVVT